MAQLTFHPAPGLSDLAPGWFVLPQNPLEQDDATVLVPTMSATAPGYWIQQPTLGDLVAGSFVVPQNPVAQNLVQGLAGLRGMGCGCSSGFGCDGGRQFYGLNGVPDDTPGTDALSQWLATNGGSFGATLANEKTFLGFQMPMWGWAAAGFAAVYTLSDLFGRGKAKTKEYARRYASS